jgi:hypothetical protein
MGRSSPLVLEVYCRQWLASLSKQHAHEVDLWCVPDDEIEGWARRGFSHIWLMGVWPTGPGSRREALRWPDVRRQYDEALPGWTDVDVVGSPYAISAYHVAPALGGDRALAAFRARLAERGMGLILDFVANHTGLDHVWAVQRPHLYVGAPVEAGAFGPAAVRRRSARGEQFLAHGKDPYFPPWTDTLQLDHRRAETRRAVQEQLVSVAHRCDGVRCDMAMLVLNDVFFRTWAGAPLLDRSAADDDVESHEFWSEAISQVRAEHPEFLFCAEAYWGTQQRLVELGFDFAYDKELYDLIMKRAPSTGRYVRDVGENNLRRIHFLENHDEPRVNTRLGRAEHRAAALLILSLPGLRLLHDGQTRGLRHFARIQLRRRADEADDEDVVFLYDTLLRALNLSFVGQGDGVVVDVEAAWAGNESHASLCVIQWQAGNDERFDVVVVNTAGHRVQGYARIHIQSTVDVAWTLVNVLGTEHFERAGAELKHRGLYLDVAPYAAQLFRFTRLAEPKTTPSSR